ncbi:relaxosome component [Escherichia coli]|nr:relaxosome component [Escherichia coli]KGM78272.1 relaxosome component [Escherichia coli]
MCNRITAHARLYDYHLVRALPRHPGKEQTMSEKKNRNGSEKRQKNVLIAVRFSPEEAEIVKEKAEKNGLTVSTLIRKTVLGKQINARIDEDFLKELMRLGHLQKHLFVEGKRTGDKEYAEVLVAITELANTLRRDLMGR